MNKYSRFYTRYGIKKRGCFKQKFWQTLRLFRKYVTAVNAIKKFSISVTEGWRPNSAVYTRKGEYARISELFP